MNSKNNDLVKHAAALLLALQPGGAKFHAKRKKNLFSVVAIALNTEARESGHPEDQGHTGPDIAALLGKDFRPVVK